MVRRSKTNREESKWKNREWGGEGGMEEERRVGRRKEGRPRREEKESTVGHNNFRKTS